MTFLTSLVVIELIAIILLALAVGGLIRQVRFLSSSAQASTGSLSPELTPQIGGEAASAAELKLQPGRPAFVMFASGGCQVCGDRFADLDVAADRMNGVDFRVVLQGDSNNGFESDHLLILRDRADLLAEWSIPVTPFGVAIDAEGVVRDARPIGSPEAISKLLDVVGGGEK